MSLLIKGLSMQEKPVTLRIMPDGKVWVMSGSDRKLEAVSIQEKQGDLMDKTAFEADIRKRYCHDCDNYNGLRCGACWVEYMLGEVEDATTIIEAEGGG